MVPPSRRYRHWACSGSPSGQSLPLTGPECFPAPDSGCPTTHWAGDPVVSERWTRYPPRLHWRPRPTVTSVRKGHRGAREHHWATASSRRSACPVQPPVRCPSKATWSRASSSAALPAAWLGDDPSAAGRSPRRPSRGWFGQRRPWRPSRTRASLSSRPSGRPWPNEPSPPGRPWRNGRPHGPPA
ncbi:hypothetical protein STAN_7060 [Streptomyces sp. CBMAI 2042]|nr:hypothetical protein STAN_7060 [Streptomyces sp. CBMAI 2042]